MRRVFVFLLLAPVFAWCGTSQAGELQFKEAQQIATLVARHDNITVDDRTIVLNSMDTRSQRGFIPGYFSFSIIKESDSPGEPDETIRMYVVSKRTADTWELNLCTHYSFPQLQQIQQKVMRETGATSSEDRAMQKDIGCQKTKDQAATGTKE